ncbi:MAG: YggS family pyridoxal phosphate-dependent enzyme [Rhodobacteraceae bacterium]|nr:YggS family pyridoxal phosphate-dependent enzyme [Paracoccaceae bacterium]RZO34190.1 MAG: YggS family pyridoxal phosphate-dependent enzyme [Paracoccaceae bacterium]|tara:strand:+ start:1613 stop:2269 length:657 start_codon:yes stop_codon:yes gene_type:complete
MSLSQVIKLSNQSERLANRKVNSVKLIAVSKVQPNEKVEAVLKEGHRCFGENRVQEALNKWPSFKENYENVELHLIGPLQTNKARQAFELFDVIQTLDRPKLAILLANLTQERGFCPSLFIQVNTGEEPQKTGVLPKDLDIFIKDCQSMDLRIDGLMCIPPLNEEPALHFSLLRKMQERNNIRFLSMGMSSDYESAIMFGATHVRIGSAIFGERVANF